MSKPARARQQSARERIAAQRAAAHKAEIRNRFLIAGGSVLVVVAIVVAFVVIKASQSPPKPSGGGGAATGTVLPANVARQVTSVPPSVLSTVGPGSVPTFTATPVTRITGSPLRQGGKPEMLYIGAEFCPYCAAMRWSMAVALSRFGTFTTPLRGIHSSPTDAYPNTATLTFYKAGYRSPYLTFTPVENETVSRAPLQPVTRQQQAIWNRYDPNSFPFIDFGNQYDITMPIYDPQVLQGKTWAQIAAALHDPSDPVAQGANGAANYITAAICKITGSKPAGVCTAPAITAIAAKL